MKNGAVTLVSYAYDALRRRIKETKPTGTTDVYFTPGGQIAEERFGTTTYQYVQGASGQTIFRDVYSSGTLQSSWRLYVQQDANNNVVALVGGSAGTAGDRQEWYWYTPYGSLQVMAGDGSPRAGTYHNWRFFFQSGRLDSSTGLYVFGLRDYDPVTGVWMVRDHIGLAAQDPNLYRFVANNPVNWFDPTGMDVQWIVNSTSWAVDIDVGGLIEPITPWNPLEILVDETKTVWRNTGTACMSTPGRLYVAGGTTMATVFGVRGWSDAFSTNDAVDGHEQSGLERATDFVTGTASLILTTKIVFPKVMKLMPGGGAGRIRIAPRGPIESPVGNPAAGECPFASSSVAGEVDPNKFKYVFGEVTSGSHNTQRSLQNAAQMNRIGIYNTAEGHAYLTKHLQDVVQDPSNVVRTFQKTIPDGRTLNFEVRESLLSGPGGFLKAESTWEVLPDGARRLSTIIPFGG